MHAALGLAVADGNVGLLLNFGEGRVKVLRIIVVECSGLAIMLAHDGHKCAHGFWLHFGFLALNGTAGTEAGHVIYAFLTALKGILLGLN